MPIYTYTNLETNEVSDITMSIAEMLEFEQLNKGKMKRELFPTAIGDSVRLGVTKSPASWNDLNKEIKNRNRHSTLNPGNGEF